MEKIKIFFLDKIREQMKFSGPDELIIQIKKIFRSSKIGGVKSMSREPLKNEVDTGIDKIASFNGINIYYIKTNKFKTNTINIFIKDDLSHENASMNALIPAVLRRGTKKYNTFKDISVRQEELYGTVFDCG